MKKQILYIYNMSFLLLGVVSDFISLTLTKKLSEYGDFELIVKKDANYLPKLVKGNMFIINKECDKGAYIIEDVEIEENQVKITGHDLKYITSFRVVMPSANSAYDRVDETEAENILKHYISTQLVDCIDSRKWNDLVIETTKNRGVRTVWQARYTNLHEELKHIHNDTLINWDILPDLKNKCFIFKCFENVDKTVNQRDVPQVIFSSKNKNYNEKSYKLYYDNYKNVGIALGNGEDEDRTMLVIYENREPKGLERREVVIEKSNISDIEELKTESQKALKEYNVINSSDGEVYSINKRWNLGDLVTIAHGDNTKESKLITKIIEKYDKENITLEVSFGDKMPELKDIFINSNYKKGVK